MLWFKKKLLLDIVKRGEFDIDGDIVPFRGRKYYVNFIEGVVFECTKNPRNPFEKSVPPLEWEIYRRDDGPVPTGIDIMLYANKKIDDTPIPVFIGRWDKHEKRFFTQFYDDVEDECDIYVAEWAYVPDDREGVDDEEQI